MVIIYKMGAPPLMSSPCECTAYPYFLANFHGDADF
jgi:hypothetical protein